MLRTTEAVMQGTVLRRAGYGCYFEFRSFASSPEPSFQISGSEVEGLRFPGHGRCLRVAGAGGVSSLSCGSRL